MGGILVNAPPGAKGWLGTTGGLTDDGHEDALAARSMLTAAAALSGFLGPGER